MIVATLRTAESTGSAPTAPMVIKELCGIQPPLAGLAEELQMLHDLAHPLSAEISTTRVQEAQRAFKTNTSWKFHKTVTVLAGGRALLESADKAVKMRVADKQVEAGLLACRSLLETLPEPTADMFIENKGQVQFVMTAKNDSSRLRVSIRPPAFILCIRFFRETRRPILRPFRGGLAEGGFGFDWKSVVFGVRAAPGGL